MAQISFTANLNRFVSCPTLEAPGGSVRAVLEAVFAGSPRLRGYILDDQGQLRQHVALFVDGEPVRDRMGLSDAVEPTSEIHVMQALSGG